MKATNRTWQVIAGGALGLMLLAAPALAGWPGDPAKCKPDAVKVGSVCMDKYEASVWQIPATNLAGKSNKKLITKVQNGKTTLAALTAGGATQISPSSSCSPAFPGTFPANGQWTEPLYAVSIPGVHPTACVTWFQAQQACANSRKRLPSNGEWQMAVAGTPEGAAGDDGSTQCNTSAAGDAVDTGSRSVCVSNYGAFDMVGNVAEWVEDWVPRSTACGSWSGSSDYQCLAGAATTGEPGALIRSADFASGAGAGPFEVTGRASPSESSSSLGFRCAR
jgi:formylglycine-generating enzyme required for sulfatase activity